jgi:DNA-binding response OmpR family regulator
MPKLELLEDEIGRKLAEAEQTGELRSGPSFGKPLAVDAGWEMTPNEFKMPFKILKNAGIVPPEVELFHERARIRESLHSATDEDARRALRKQLTELEQRLSLRLEALQRNGAL